MRTMLDDCTRRFVEKLIKPFEKLHWFMFDRSITRFSFSMKVFPSQSVCRYTSQSQTFRHSFPFPTGNDHIIASLWFLVIFRQVSSDDSKRNKPIISRYYIRLHLRKSETTNKTKKRKPILITSRHNKLHAPPIAVEWKETGEKYEMMVNETRKGYRRVSVVIDARSSQRLPHRRSIHCGKSPSRKQNNNAKRASFAVHWPDIADCLRQQQPETSSNFSYGAKWVQPSGSSEIFMVICGLFEAKLRAHKRGKSRKPQIYLCGWNSSHDFLQPKIEWMNENEKRIKSDFDFEIFFLLFCVWGRQKLCGKRLSVSRENTLQDYRDLVQSTCGWLHTEMSKKLRQCVTQPRAPSVSSLDKTNTRRRSIKGERIDS